MAMAPVSGASQTKDPDAALILALMLAGLCGQLGYLMIFRSEHYSERAKELHERERTIKAAMGRDPGPEWDGDRGQPDGQHRFRDPQPGFGAGEGDRRALRRTGASQEEVQKKVEKHSSREIIKTNVAKETGDRIRSYGLSGIKVDEDYKRYYPYGSMASKVLGFTGADNQGIIGLEVMYESVLKGTDGRF